MVLLDYVAYVRCIFVLLSSSFLSKSSNLDNSLGLYNNAGRISKCLQTTELKSKAAAFVLDECI